MLEFIGFVVVCWVGLVVIKAIYIAWGKGRHVNVIDTAVSKEILYTINFFSSEVSFISQKNVEELTVICTEQFYNRHSGEEDFSVFDILLNVLTGHYFQPTIDGSLQADISLRYYLEIDRFLRNNPTFASKTTEKLLSFWKKILISKGVDPFNFLVAL